VLGIQRCIRRYGREHHSCSHQFRAAFRNALRARRDYSATAKARGREIAEQAAAAGRMLFVLAGAALRASPLTIAAVSGTILTAALIVTGHCKNWVAWRVRRRKER